MSRNSKYINPRSKESVTSREGRVSRNVAHVQELSDKEESRPARDV